MKNKTPILFVGSAVSAVAALFLILPFAANAFTPTTWTVDGHANDKCTVAQPDCTTIQDAINASSNGDTINVNAGTYLSGFTVNGKTNLTINGSGDGTGAGATIIEPSSLISTGVSHKYTQNMQVSVFVGTSTNLTLENLRIEGNLQSPGVGGPDALLFWDASSGTVNDVAVEGNYTINGYQTGQGIAVDGGTTVLTVKGTSISGFQKNGIDIEDGNCYLNASDATICAAAGSIAVTIQNGSITGAGATTQIAQNGVVAWNEGGGTVSATINGSDISDLRYTGSEADTDADGILAYGTASIPTIANVTFQTVQQYIGSASSGTTVHATNGNTFNGVSPSSATTAQLATIENKLDGEMETSGSDPIFILPHTWIVTASSTVNLGIQAALNDASNGDTVLVTPGSYSGNFTINKSIVFDGAQFGQAVSGRIFNSSNESTITGASNGSAVLTITAPDVTVDGFSLTNVRSAFAGIGITVQADSSTIQNNILNNISTADTGVNDTAEAIYFQGPLSGGSVAKNLMENVQSKGSAKGILFGDDTKGDGSTNVTVNGNTISNITSTAKGAYGISFGNTTNAQSGIVIKNNTITGLNGAGWAHGIGVEGNTPSIDIENNAFSNFTSPAPIAIWFESEDQASFTGATVKGNDLSLTSSQVGVGVDPALTGGTVDAQGNWWGNQSGPTDTVSTDGSIPATNPNGVGSTAYGAVKYGDWCTNAACTTFSNLTVPTPSITTPTNDEVVTTASLTEIDWTSVTDAAGGITYNYEASNASSTNADGSFTSPIATVNGVTGTTLPSPNTPQGTYFIHVQAVDSYGNVSPWSSTVEVTVDNTPSVVTDAATSFGDTNATLNATVGPINADNTSFWWGTTNVGPFTAGSAPTVPADWQNDSGLGSQSANAAFNEAVSNLTPGTTYYFVAWVESNGTWYPGNVVSFMTTGTAPVASVTTDAASSVDLTDGTLNGTNGAIAASNTSFWWGTTATSSFTAAADPSSELPSGWSHDSGLGSAAVNGTFDEPLSGLTPNTEYYYAAWSQVGGIWYPGTILNFTTNTPAAVTTDAANPVNIGDATLNGTNGPNAADSTSFWYGTSAAGTLTASANPYPSELPSGWLTTGGNAGAGAGAAFNYDATNLAPNTTYNFVAWSEVGGIWYPGAVESFTTGAGASSAVTTDAANPIDSTDATLNATEGATAGDNTSFWYGTSSTGPFTAGSNPAPSELPSGWSTTGVNAGANAGAGFDYDATSLSPSTTYYYAAWSEIGGIWYPGAVDSFITNAPAAVTTDAASSVSDSDATLNGTDGPVAADDVSFWVSLSPTIDTSNPNSIPSGVYSTPVTSNIAANGAFSDQLSITTTSGIPSNMPAITDNTTYYYVAWANIGGTWYPGSVESFTTSDTAPVITNEGFADASPTSVIVTWTTDHPATSRVVYDTSSHADGDTSTCTSPDSTSYQCYGYAYTTNEDTTLTTNHSVTVTGLTPGTEYFFRPVSQGSPEDEGDEGSVTTPSASVSPTTDAATNVTDSDATMNAMNGDTDADAASFWVSTSTIDFSDPNTIPAGVYSTPVLSAVSANATFADQLSLVTTAGITTGGTNENMMPITPSTTYYYVAWASVGGTWYNGGQQTVTTSATPPVAPTAVADTATTDINTEVTIDVLANDTGSPTGVTDITAPTEGGTAVVDADGTDIDYTPANNFSGTDTFTYEATNSVGASSPATVSVTVVDTATPVLTVVGDNPVNIEVSSTYDDQGVTISDVGSPNIGYVMSLDGEATTSITAFNSADLLSTTTPGTHTILYAATNGGGNTGYATRTVNVLVSPTVSLTSTSATTGTISDDPIQVTATFSEPVQNFTSADASTTNGAVSNVQLTGTTGDYTSATFDVTPTANGTVTVEVVPGAVENLAGGTNADDEQISFTYAASTPAPTPTFTPTFTGGGNGPISGSFGSFGPGSGGQVLGASTSTIPTVDESCAMNTPLITTYMRIGMKNSSSQVMALQQFLDTQLGLNIPITGFFGVQTENGVKAFQLKYASDILTPWNLTQPTGFVYLTTERWINLVNCSALNIPLPTLVPFQG